MLHIQQQKSITFYKYKTKEITQIHATALTGKLQATTYRRKHKYVNCMKGGVKGLAFHWLDKMDEWSKRIIKHIAEIKR